MYMGVNLLVSHDSIRFPILAGHDLIGNRFSIQNNCALAVRDVANYVQCVTFNTHCVLLREEVRRAWGWGRGRPPSSALMRKKPL